MDEWEMKLPTRSVFLIVILLGVFVASANFVSPVNAVVDVTILSYTGYLDSSGYYHVVGEVQNIGDQAVTNVMVQAIFNDSSDNYIASPSEKAELNVLLVGRKAPFEIVLRNTAQSAKVDHYSVDPCTSCIHERLEPFPMGLEILSNSSYTDGVGWYNITGEIKNIETGTANYVKVIATYYDETGNVVDTESNYSDPTYIEPGQKATFNITLSSERVPYVDGYELTAESIQYAIVGGADGADGANNGAEAADDGVEFPAWTLILPILIVLTIAIVVYKRRHKRKRRLPKRSIRRN